MSIGTLTVVGLVVLAVLVWFFMRLRRQDVLTAMMEKRRAGARLVARAEYVEGLERMPVVLALTSDTFHYENGDLEASFELPRIDEVEYGNELATGKNLHEGEQVLRLRSHGATFEFVLPTGDSAKWQAVLPARQLGRANAANG
ncbi:MAG TPA: hypothetical protein VMS98_16860 [Thermoanaerobaculia bacterium]|nr:hypothetical protein [Thermoanaerobaculia bacterium]